MNALVGDAAHLASIPEHDPMIGRQGAGGQLDSADELTVLGDPRDALLLILGG
jgi:hypothetical protein